MNLERNCLGVAVRGGDRREGRNRPGARLVPAGAEVWPAPWYISLCSGNRHAEAFLVSVAGLVYVSFIVRIYLLVTVFDLWLLNVFNRAKRPNCFLSSGPTQRQARKGYLYLTLMYFSVWYLLISDQVHKHEP